MITKGTLLDIKMELLREKEEVLRNAGYSPLNPLLARIAGKLELIQELLERIKQQQ